MGKSKRRHPVVVTEDGSLVKLKQGKEFYNVTNNIKPPSFHEQMKQTCVCCDNPPTNSIPLNEENIVVCDDDDCWDYAENLVNADADNYMQQLDIQRLGKQKESNQEFSMAPAPS